MRGLVTTREGRVPNLLLLRCGAVALLCSAASAHAGVDPLVLTIDAHHYLVQAPLVLTPALHLAQAPETRLSNCRRTGGLPLALGVNRLIYGLAGASLDARAMRIEFKPTRVVLDTEFGDVVCDGVALGGETGVERVFGDWFEG
jgi:hypothetical protein